MQIARGGNVQNMRKISLVKLPAQQSSHHNCVFSDFRDWKRSSTRSKIEHILAFI